jgi:NADPH2:quinone reductase
VRAAVIHELGGPEVLHVEEVPDPVPVDGQVLVRIEAAGINRYDLNLRAWQASSLPMIVGVDASGVREDTGERVLVTGVFGCYAELVAAPATNVWPIPDELPTAVAAAIGMPYRTAAWALGDIAELKQGETLLVQGGSSSTGQACIDIGRRLGARVYATGKSEALGEFCEQLGATAYEYDDERLDDLEADVIFDPVGGEGFGRTVERLAHGGRLVTPGALDEPNLTFNAWTLVHKKGQILGTGSTPSKREAVAEIIDRVASGELHPTLAREFPLEDVAAAHRLIETRSVFGRVVLRP